MLTGTIFYSRVEGWSWLDALYFSVITLTTVSYGDLSPTLALTKKISPFTHYLTTESCLSLADSLYGHPVNVAIYRNFDYGPLLHSALVASDYDMEQQPALE